MLIPDDIIAEIRQRADIAAVIGQYVPLRQRGKNYVGLCPFHAEKTPSFNVSPQLGIYKCFGCGKSGDVFSFLMEYVGMSFVEAARHLADQLGIQLPSDDERSDAATAYRRTLRAALRAAARYYRECLHHPEAATARQFLQQRGISEAMSARFELGYAPAGWTATLQKLLAEGFTREQLIDAGLLIARDDGSTYDRFRHRLIFPIHAPHGDVIAFGARQLSPDDEPKYLNSPQTPLYDKSFTLYALYQAKHALTRTRTAVIVEGYLDAIALHSIGIEQTVATAGTALTQRHLEQLRRYVDGVVLVFDGDTAGQEAAHRAVAVALRTGIAAEVVLLPEGEDPDSLVRTRDADAVKNILSRRLSPVEFLVTHSQLRYDWSNKLVATRQIRAIADVIAAMPDVLYRELLLRELSDRVGIARELLEVARSPQVAQPVPRAAIHQPQHRVPPILPEEALILRAALISRTLAQEIFEEFLLEPSALPSPPAAALLAALEQHLNTDSSDLPPGHALPHMQLDPQVRELAEWLIFTEELPSQRWNELGATVTAEHFYRQQLSDAVRKLEQRHLEQQLAELRRRLEREPDNIELLQQIDRLHKLRVELQRPRQL